MAYYTVDRLKSLALGQSIELAKYTDVQPPELQAHVDQLFPEGVSAHGERYLLRGSTKATVISPSIELVVEYIRRCFFPHRPSRFQCMFGWERLDDALRFRQKFAEPDSPIWQVEPTGVFCADMSLLTLKNSILASSYIFHLYWAGKSLRNEIAKEVLLIPPVKVVEEVQCGTANKPAGGDV